MKVNAVLNGIRQICAILFPLITFPYVSRVLGSAGFGKYNFSQSVTGYFILLAALGIDTYAIREGAKIRDEKETVTRFCSQVFSINVVTGLVSLCALGILLILNVKIGGYAPYILVESVAIPLAVIGTNWVNSIYEDYLYLTLRYIAIQVIALAAMFLFVRKPSDVLAYCVIAVFATNGGNLINLFYVRKYVRIRFTFYMEWGKHLIPLLLLFVNAVAIMIYVNADIIMLGFYADDAVVGVYSFAARIYSILKQLINAVIVVSLPRISYVIKNRSEAYDAYMRKLFSALSILMLPVVTGMLFMSNSMILIAGGAEYITGDVALKILSVATLFAIYASLFTNCVLIVNRQEKKCLIATSISAVINVGLNLILLPYIGMIGAAITTIIAEMVNCAIQIWYSRPYFHWKKLGIRENLACLPGVVLIAVICVLCNHLIPNVFLRMGVAILCSATVYSAVLVLFRHPYMMEVLQSVKNRLTGRRAA